MSTQVFFQSPVGPLQGSRVKIRGHMIAHRTPVSPRLNSRMPFVDHCALAQMISECCLYHAHIIDSGTEASRSLVPYCGTTATWHFQFSSRNWKRPCLELVTVETAALYFMRFYKTLTNTLTNTLLLKNGTILYFQINSTNICQHQ